MATITPESGSSSGLSLAIRLRDGSAQAWSQLVELYGPLVESWSAQAGLDPAAREDIAQEVFLAVHRSIGDFDPQRPNATFRGWLWRITRNAVIQRIRRHEIRGTGGSTAHEQLMQHVDPWPDATPSQPPSNVRDMRTLLRRAMQQVRPHVEQQTWQAFWQTAVLGRSAADVAAELSMTPASVRQAKSRTLRRLRQQLGD